MKKIIRPSISKIIVIVVFINIILLMPSKVTTFPPSLAEKILPMNILLLIWWLSKKRITMININNSIVTIRVYNPILRYSDNKFQISELCFRKEEVVEARGIKNIKYFIICSSGVSYDLTSTFTIWKNQDIQFLSEVIPPCSEK